MATIERFEDLQCWQKARELSIEVYEITKAGNFAKDFEMKGQIRAASGSIMDNIAEGFDRGGRDEFKQFLTISKGSTGEVKSQLYRALDQRYINEEKFNKMYDKANVIAKQIDALRNYLLKTEIKGRRYKKP
ncbi:MAG: four helix bundle protein [Spirosomataceae bacterium]